MSTSARGGGLIVVDKPEGPSSFAAVARVRKVMGTREVGHCGTLDPLASGVLVVAVGAFTRLVRVLTADDKRYLATIELGSATTTDDREGDVIARADPGALARLTQGDLEGELARMLGAQLQVPPAYSAIHVQGARAYERARRGETVEMAPREVTIHALRLLAFEQLEGLARATVEVHCGKGTYVRSIARDLGARVGVPAHLRALRRTASGSYTLEDATPLDALSTASLRAGPDAVRGVPRVAVTNEQALALRQGRRVPLAGGLSDHPEVQPGTTTLAHLGEELVALVRVEGGALVVERGFAAP